MLFASASAVRALWPSETSLVASIVTVSLALTPLSLLLGRYFLKEEPREELEEDFEGAGGNVLVIGFGRFGQILAQILLARHVNATILDASAERVRQAARFGFRIYFGDGTRRDVLRAAGAEQASIICVCVDKADVANRIVDLVMHEFPGAKVYVRTWDRRHTLELLAKGVDYELRETFKSALAFGAETLRGIGFTAGRGGRGRSRSPASRCRPARRPVARRPGGGRCRRQAAGRDAGAALGAGTTRGADHGGTPDAAPDGAADSRRMIGASPLLAAPQVAFM